MRNGEGKHTLLASNVPHLGLRPLASVEQNTALPSLGDRATFSGSSKAHSFAPYRGGELPNSPPIPRRGGEERSEGWGWNEAQH